MDKSRKLRRYSRKDYSQLVDFPVEIVGRDGVVRRYSFEESVRLYQRRIASAPMRYEDGDIAQAEVRHCQRRIEQLRKSYFARYGWSRAEAPEPRGRIGSELAGEVAAFLRRCSETEGGQVRLDNIELVLLDAQANQELYYLQRRGSRDAQAGDLLYLHRFEHAGTCPQREAFFAWLKMLQGVRRAGIGVEGLVGFHHTADCGLILTRRSEGLDGGGGSVDGPEAALLEEEPAAPGEPFASAFEVAPDPLREAMLLLRQGNREPALDAFERAYESSPYLRGAYLGAVVVADLLGAHSRAETAALMGSRYFPDDALLLYHLGVARLRTGDLEGAAEAHATLQERDSSSPASALLGALLALRNERMGEGRRQLRRALRLTQQDSDLEGACRLVQLQLLGRSIFRLGGLCIVLAGLAGFAAGWPGALLLCLPGFLLLPLAQLAWRHRLRQLLAAPGAGGLRLATPGALRAEPEAEQ